MTTAGLTQYPRPLAGAALGSDIAGSERAKDLNDLKELLENADLLKVYAENVMPPASCETQADYDAWFDGQVSEALDGAGEPAFDHDEAMAVLDGVLGKLCPGKGAQ